ncbi:MAG: MATE family efflux transporter, partial [Christensenellaceae bacterium]|nr:MATE family efflux transporter [Christensenellaceae bacterium]
MKKFLEKNRYLFAVRTENGTLTLLVLLWPLLLENVLRNLMSTVNTALLGRFDEGAVSAVGIASQILNLVLTIHWVISGGASVVISQNLGAGNRKKAAQV